MYLPIPRLHLFEINDQEWYIPLLSPGPWGIPLNRLWGGGVLNLTNVLKVPPFSPIPRPNNPNPLLDHSPPINSIRISSYACRARVEGEIRRG